MNEEIQEEDRELEEPIDPPQEKNPHKRKHAWVQENIQGAERYGVPEENLRERKRTRSCLNLPIMKRQQNGKNGRML